MKHGLHHIGIQIAKIIDTECSKHHHAVDEVSLHNIKVEVWYAVGAHQVKGPTFFTEIGYDHYIKSILTPLFRD
jgi:hypothetical protein